MNSRPGAAAEAVVDELKAVIAKSIAGNIQVVGRVRDLVRTLAADPHGASEPLRDPGSLVTRWIDFNIASLRILTEHSLGTLNDLVSVAESRLHAAPAPSPAPAPVHPEPAAAAEPVDLRLEGTRGSVLTAPFLVENFYDHALEVSFEAGPLTSPGHQPMSAIVVNPPVLRLPAKGQQVVQANLTIGPEFVAGATYEAQVRLVGFAARTLRVVLRVLAEEPVVQAPAKTRQKGKNGTGKRKTA